jgi:hypothetical protein
VWLRLARGRRKWATRIDSRQGDDDGDSACHFFFLISIASQRCLCAGVLKFAIGCNLQIGSSAAILRDHSEKALFLRLFHDFLDFSSSTSKVFVLASHDKIRLRRVMKT